MNKWLDENKKTVCQDAITTSRKLFHVRSGCGLKLNITDRPKFLKGFSQSRVWKDENGRLARDNNFQEARKKSSNNISEFRKGEKSLLERLYPQLMPKNKGGK